MQPENHEESAISYKMEAWRTFASCNVLVDDEKASSYEGKKILRRQLCQGWELWAPVCWKWTQTCIKWKGGLSEASTVSGFIIPKRPITSTIKIHQNPVALKTTCQLGVVSLVLVPIWSMFRVSDGDETQHQWFPYRWKVADSKG